MPAIRILQPDDQPALEAFTLPRVETSMFLLGNSRVAGLVDQGQPYQGTYAGAFESNAEGAFESNAEGAFECNAEGAFECNVEGAFEGNAEGAFEGNAEGAFEGNAEGAFEGTVEGERMVGVVAHYWNNMLILQVPPRRGQPLLDDLCRAAVRASGRPIGGLIGPAAQVRAARDALGIDAADVQMDEQEKLYSLSLEKLVVPEGLHSGRLVGRRIQARDVDLVIQWKVGLSVEALDGEDTPQLRQRLRASVERSVGEGRTWVLEDGGICVSTSGFNTAIREAVQIGGVYTPPEFRRRGYARAVVAASLLDARAEGVERAILFTGESNLPAQRAYTALGFRHMGDYGLLILREPLAGTV